MTDGVSTQHTDVSFFPFTSILAEDHVVGYSRPSLITITPNMRFLDAAWPHSMKQFCLWGNGVIFSATRRGDPPVWKPDSRGWNPGSRAEGYTTTMWPFCIWWCGAAANEQPEPGKPLLLTGHAVNSGLKDTSDHVVCHIYCRDPVLCRPKPTHCTTSRSRLTKALNNKYLSLGVSSSVPTLCSVTPMKIHKRWAERQLRQM